MSIKTLYRAMQGQDTPVLMVIKDSDGQVSYRIQQKHTVEVLLLHTITVSLRLEMFLVYSNHRPFLQVFGALASEPFKVSDGFYGTGETFLFTFNPEFEVRCPLLFEDVGFSVEI